MDQHANVILCLYLVQSFEANGCRYHLWENDDYLDGSGVESQDCQFYWAFCPDT